MMHFREIYHPPVNREDRRPRDRIGALLFCLTIWIIIFMGCLL